MKRVELKRIAELLWRGPSDGEKAPFAQAPVVEHGSISKDFSAENGKPPKEFPLQKTDELDGPMSLTRKFCFVMSFNAWILYFLVLGWLLPCRNLNCDFQFADVYENNLTDIWSLTNLETFNEKGLPSLAMLGYADGKFLYLAALKTSDGNVEWNRSLKFIPRKIQCNFDINFDANGDGIPDCLLSGYNDVYAFNATNGYVFWEQNLPSDFGNIVSNFHPTLMHDGKSYLVGTCGDKIIVLNAQNGTKHSEASLPCLAPFDIRIASSNINNLSSWYIVCDYGDKMETWAFTEEEVLSGGKSNYDGRSPRFVLLFSDTNSDGSIDLGCDVTPIPGGLLLLSWSNQVVMVTSNGTVWKKSFSYPTSVASIIPGHFTDPKILQIAVAIHNESDAVIFVLEAGTGTAVDSVFLAEREPQSLSRISGELDVLVLKSLSMNYTGYNATIPMPEGKTNFAMVEFTAKRIVKNIVTASDVVDSTLNLKTDGGADLLLIKLDDGMSSFQKYVIYRSDTEENALCKHGTEKNHVPHYASEI